MDILTNLRKYRTEKGLSQTEIADYLGTTQQQYSKYELGTHEIPTRHILSLCKLYGITTDTLLGNKKQMSQVSKNALKALEYIENTSFSSFDEFIRIAITENKLTMLKENMGLHIAYAIACEKTGEKRNNEYFCELAEQDSEN